MNPLTVSPERLQRLRAACLGLPLAVEKVAWGDPTWRVRDKIFAMQKGNYEGGRPSLWLKAPDGAQSALVEGQPERFFVPPYVGHKGWVGAYLDTRSVDWPLLESLIEESYRLIAPKQLAALVGGETQGDEMAARETAARETAARETAARETAARETAARKRSKKKAPALRTAKKKKAKKKAPAGRAAKKKVTARAGQKQVKPLSRPRHAMPAFVKQALSEGKLTAAYKARPAYQQNDYVGWINGAKLPATQQKRLDQMLQELKGGKRYMNMKWSGSSE